MTEHRNYTDAFKKSEKRDIPNVGRVDVYEREIAIAGSTKQDREIVSLVGHGVFVCTIGFFVGQNGTKVAVHFAMESDIGYDVNTVIPRELERVRRLYLPNERIKVCIIKGCVANMSPKDAAKTLDGGSGLVNATAAKNQQKEIERNNAFLERAILRIPNMTLERKLSLGKGIKSPLANSSVVLTAEARLIGNYVSLEPFEMTIEEHRRRVASNRAMAKYQIICDDRSASIKRAIEEAWIREQPSEGHKR